MRDANLLDELRQLLGPGGLSADREALTAHETDWSNWGRSQPLAVARPRTTEEVSRLLALCHRAGQAVVPQGGLTGFAGGAIPAGEALALSLERMTGVEEIDRDAATMTVKAGTTLQAAQDAAEAEGFLLALDLGARGSCQVGGNVSTNAGGNRVIRYGMTREQVLGLEAVLADGTVIDAMSKLIKDNAGFSLKHLFIGSEGALGVVTRIVFRLHALPPSQNVALVACSSFDDVLAMLRRARSAFGGRLTAYETMWRVFIEAAHEANAALRDPFPRERPCRVLIELRGEDEVRDRGDLEDFLAGQLEALPGTEAVVAQSGQECRELWSLRDSAGEITRRLGNLANLDVSIPIAHMGDFVERCRETLTRRWPAGRTVFFGHVGDGNVHVLFGSPDFPAGEKPGVEAAVYDLVQEYGGSIAAEHGIGRVKSAYLDRTRSAAEIALMRTLKRALDPKGILNPGAVLGPMS